MLKCHLVCWLCHFDFVDQLEEERIHMQTKAWEMSQASERLFDQLHKAEARYDEVQQNFEQFRQDHRTCVPVSFLASWVSCMNFDADGFSCY